MKRTLGAALLVAAGMALTGCAGSTSPTDGDTSQFHQYAPNGQYAMCVQTQYAATPWPWSEPRYECARFVVDGKTVDRNGREVGR